jgi:hypothetical protein
MTALQQAERACEKAERRAIAARRDVSDVAPDSRLLGTLNPSHPLRVQWTKAKATAEQAERAADEARAKLEALKAPKDKSPRKAREALRSAISSAASAARAASRRSSAVQRAEQMVTDAHRQVEASTAALEKAGEQDAKKAAAAAASGKKVAPVSTIAKRKTELEAAEAALEAARAGREQLEAEGSELTAAANEAKQKIEAAITDVLKAELPVQAMIQRCSEAQAELVRRRIALRELVRSGVATKDEKSEIERLMHEVLPVPYGDVELWGTRWNEHAVAQSWAKLRAKLAHDPDAALDEFKL